MVTAVGPNGRLGETLASPWAEIVNAAVPKTPSGPVVLRNGYNSDKGVTVHIEWPQTSEDSCYYTVQLSNSTTEVKTEIILDSSASLLIPHLEFQTQYTVAVTATSADRSQSSKPLSANFMSLQCKDVHGQGSLQCAPEPVSNLAVVVRPNGTAAISWQPSAEQENILFYQLISNALSEENGCRTRHETVNLRAVSYVITSVRRITESEICTHEMV
ncbi:fibronectin type III domain protein [Oesophagostomum dentatum]|uniref:Fibronectin type III domain protein n=1 Tax=Oesophagostomum dentatum TaxID=61180 RepID=A0A0B1TN45_OESDE|nr:fibronectin type III domain protein [Oesophagostomum dentatum]